MIKRWVESSRVLWKGSDVKLHEAGKVFEFFAHTTGLVAFEEWAEGN